MTYLSEDKRTEVRQLVDQGRFISVWQIIEEAYEAGTGLRRIRVNPETHCEACGLALSIFGYCPWCG